jgi:hypothetical protein
MSEPPRKLHRQLLIDLDRLIRALHEQHRYWDIHIVGEDDNVRVDVHYKIPRYDLKKSETDSSN